LKPKLVFDHRDAVEHANPGAASNDITVDASSASPEKPAAAMPRAHCLRYDLAAAIPAWGSARDGKSLDPQIHRRSVD
jgi:hypothetical protein